MRRKLRLIPMLATLAALQLFIGGTVLAANEDDGWAETDEYRAGDFGRVLYSENGVTLQRAAHEPGAPPTEEAFVNSPVFPGDTLHTGYDQRVEVQLARGSLVRVDRASEITFLALPDPYADYQDNSVLQVLEGTIQISAFVDDREEFRIDTPASSIYLLSDGDFRIEVSSQGRTRVISHRGIAEVVGNSGSALVRGGMLAEVYPGSVPGTPEPFNTFLADSFDRWVDDRDASRRVSDRYAGSDDVGYSAEVYEEIPEEVQPYYAELSRHGRWVYVADYGQVWHPLGVSATWRPYYDGYWSYGPSGYFWVSNESWGWAPYHYGRWNWVAGYGWCWIPGRVFGGAWVAWSWGSLHVGWAPLDYWNRPGFYGPTYYGYYDPHVWTFVDYDHIHYRHYPRYAVPLDRIRERVARHAVVTRPPRVSPRRLADSSEWRDRAHREALADGRGRLNPISRDDTPGRTLRDVDRGLRGRIAQTRAGQRDDRERGREGGIGGGRRGDPGSRATPETAARPGSTRSLTGNTSTNAGRTVTYPRRISSPDADGSRSMARPGGRSRADVPGDGSARAPAAGRAETGRSAESNERRGDLYRRMSSPRTTQERSTVPAGAGRADRSSSRSESATRGSRSQGDSSRSKPTAAPRPRSGSNSGNSSARGSSSRSEGSRAGASSGRSGSSSGGKKTPARSSGSSSRSESGGKKPEAMMSRTVRPGSPSQAPGRARSSSPVPRTRSTAPSSGARSGSGRSASPPVRRSTPTRSKPSSSSARSGSGGSKSRSTSARSSSRSSGKSSPSRAGSGSSGSSRSGSGSRSSGRSSGKGGRGGKK